MVAHEASATAIASVQENTFSVRPYYFSVDGVITGGSPIPPEGITVRSLSPRILSFTQVTGNASVDVNADVGAGPTPNFVFGTIEGTATADSDGYAYLEYMLAAALSITNDTGFDIDYFVMRTVFSAFNPGGPGIGAIVDDASREFARIESGQSGPGIGDHHACDTRLPPSGSNQTYPQPTPGNACGVFSPDSSESEFVIADFASGEEEIGIYTLTFALEEESIAEPSVVAVLVAGLVSFAAFGRLKRHGAHSRFGHERTLARSAPSHPPFATTGALGRAYQCGAKAVARAVLWLRGNANSGYS
jgi:hypothetical protein